MSLQVYLSESRDFAELSKNVELLFFREVLEWIYLKIFTLPG